MEEIEVGGGARRSIQRARRSSQRVRRVPSITAGLGAAPELSSYVNAALLPRPTPCYPSTRNRALPKCVKWVDISTQEESLEYARRFFHAAVERAKRHSPGSPLFALWADVARLYALAHTIADMGKGLLDVRQKLADADQKSATAMAIEKRGGIVPAPSPGPRRPDVPVTDSEPAPRPRAPYPLPPVEIEVARQAGIHPLSIAAAAVGAGLLAYWTTRRSPADNVEVDEEVEEEYF